MKIPPVTHTQDTSKAPHEGEVQAILDSHCAKYPKGIPAGCNLQVMLGKDGKKSYLLHAGEIRHNGPQNWGSTSKQFTAACIDKLVKQGKIAYDDDIRKLCPDLPVFKLNGVVQKVTVDDLLHMRSGLPEVWAISLMDGYDAETRTNDELLGLLHQHPGMVFSPGSKEMYCNTNYYLLAKIVEDVSGRPFVDYVREEVLQPLEMQARCSIDPSCPETIPGYDGDMNSATSPNRSYGTTGLIGPPSDMVQWNAAIARGDYDLLELPRGIGESSKDLYCRGLIVGHRDDYRLIFHGGMLDGAVTIYRRYEHKDPNKTFAFFLTSNVASVSEAERTADKVANELAGKEIEIVPTAGEHQQLARSQEKDAEIFSGTYRCLEFGTEWIVEPKEKEPGKWSVFMKLADGRKFPSFELDPKFEKGSLVFQSSYGKGTVARTQDGFVYNSENMAPVHFIKLNK